MACLRVLQVAKQAEGHVLQLLAMVKLPGLRQLPGSVAIVGVKSVAYLAQQRPQYLGRVMPTLLSIASSSASSATNGGVRAGLQMLLTSYCGMYYYVPAFLEDIMWLVPH